MPRELPLDKQKGVRGYRQVYAVTAWVAQFVAISCEIS